MGRKKGVIPVEPTEFQILQNNFKEAVGKIRVLEARVRGLISYTEYVAGSLDLTVSYADYLAEIISKNSSFQTDGKFGISFGERVPTFKEFKGIHENDSQDEILF